MLSLQARGVLSSDADVKMGSRHTNPRRPLAQRRWGLSKHRTKQLQPRPPDRPRARGDKKTLSLVVGSDTATRLRRILARLDADHAFTKLAKPRLK